MKISTIFALILSGMTIAKFISDFHRYEFMFMIIDCGLYMLAIAWFFELTKNSIGSRRFSIALSMYALQCLLSALLLAGVTPYKGGTQVDKVFQVFEVNSWHGVFCTRLLASLLPVSFIILAHCIQAFVNCCYRRRGA